MQGKVALITGGASGMGAQQARLLVEHNCKVVIGDVSHESGSALAAEIGENAVFVDHDVTSESDWLRAVEMAVAQFGALNILVNNAGMHWARPIVDETASDFKHMLEVHLVGTFLGIKAVAPVMVAAGGGSIVNISSTAGLTAFAGNAAYGSAKWGVRGLTKIAAVELASDNIRVNSIHPGPTKTGLTQYSDDRIAAIARSLPLGRMGSPLDIAEAVAFLASDAAAFITGAELAIDGGHTAGPPATPRNEPNV